MRSGLAILTNRAAATVDGWIHIVPRGELPNEAGIVQVLDDPALDAILADLRAQAAGERWPGLHAGREHFVYDPDQDSEALAWFKTFEKREDGIWASDDGLTDIGREAVQNGRYKFTSFVVDREKPGAVEPLDGNRVRVLKVDTIGFTNAANGKDLLTPAMNRASGTRRTPTQFHPRQVLPPLAVSFPPRSGHTGSDVFNAALALVRNRTTRPFSILFNQFSQSHGDCFQRDYSNFDTARAFGLLLNRIENRTGFSGIAAVERTANDIAALTNRFARPFLHEPAAMQWDIISRAADELDRLGVAEILMNRAPEGVTEGDWKRATSREEDVRALLDSEATQTVDRGPLLETAPPSQIRGLFRRAVQRLLGDSIDPKQPGNLNRRQAFDWLKANEPVFWTLAMLSFEPFES